MKKALAIAGILALAVTPTVSFADHLELKESEIRSGGDLAHTNLRARNLIAANLQEASLVSANLSGGDLTDANLTFANLSGVRASNLRGCPSSLPSGWFCENNSLIQR